MIVNRAATGIKSDGKTIIEVHEITSGEWSDSLFAGLPVELMLGAFIVVSYPRADYARLNRIIQAKMIIKDTVATINAARVLASLI